MICVDRLIDRIDPIATSLNPPLKQAIESHTLQHYTTLYYYYIVIYLLFGLFIFKPVGIESPHYQIVAVCWLCLWFVV